MILNWLYINVGRHIKETKFKKGTFKVHLLQKDSQLKKTRYELKNKLNNDPETLVVGLTAVITVLLE